MHCLKAIIILLLAFFGYFSSPADAQVNLKTGYNLSIPALPELDQAISSYNASQSYTSPFSKVNWLHGLEAGIRLKTGSHALEFTYQSAYQVLKATGQSADEAYTDKIKIAVHSAAVGYQLSEGIFGLGTDLQYQFYKTKFTGGLNENTFKNIQRMTGLKFYLMFTLKGGHGIDMALQPYYVLPFKYYDISPFANYLQVESAAENNKWTRFGMTVLFYNGEK